MPNARWQIVDTTVMKLDGQVQVVLSGTVFDADARYPTGPNIISLAPELPTNMSPIYPYPISVRNVRTV